MLNICERVQLDRFSGCPLMWVRGVLSLQFEVFCEIRTKTLVCLVCFYDNVPKGTLVVIDFVCVQD